MAPSPGDPPSGLVAVFKGLTGSKLSRSSLYLAPPTSTSVSAQSVHANEATAPKVETLSESHLEILKLLRNGSPAERAAAAGTLRYAIAQYPLRPVLDVWDAAKDMVAPGEPVEVRSAGWELLAECGKHPASTDLERKEYFGTLASTQADASDFHLQLAALVDLTKRGRDLSGIDYDVIPLVTGWLRDTFERAKTAKKAAREGGKGSPMHSVAAGEAKNMAQLYQYIIDVIKFSSNVAIDTAVTELVECLLDICLRTSSEDDLRTCIMVVDAIVTFTSIPPEKLKGIVDVLSSIFCMVPNLEKHAWHTISIICRSHNGQATIKVLLDVLKNARTKRPLDSNDDEDEKAANREIRGALAVLRRVLTKDQNKRFPPIPSALLIQGLANASKAASTPKVHFAIVELINCLFDCGDGSGQVHPMMVDEDWTVVLEAAAECSSRVRPARVVEGAPSSKQKADQHRLEESLRGEIFKLVICLDRLMKNKTTVDHFVPRPTIAKFFVSVHRLLPDVTAHTVLDYYHEFRYCSPPDANWRENLRLVQTAFFNDRHRSSETRAMALRNIVDAVQYMDMMMADSSDEVTDIIRDLLQTIHDEEDVSILEMIVQLTTSIAVGCNMALFDYMFTALDGILGLDRLRSPASLPQLLRPGTPGATERPPPQSHSASSHSVPTRGNNTPSTSPTNVVARGYARVFMNCMSLDAHKAVRAFNQLINIARSKNCETDARLTAMKVLFRLRADWNNRIHLTTHVDVEQLAEPLYRTELSIARKQAEDAFPPPQAKALRETRPARGASFSQGQQNQERVNPIRMASTATRPPPQQQQRDQPMWSHPDSDPILANMPKGVTPLLVSCVEDGTAPTTVVLNMAAWLQTILNMLIQGTDWELYSYVLVHLPSQLSNHAVFRGAISQIQEVRRVVCQVMLENKFQEPPRTWGLRRSDVAICYYQTLTTILSYHAHFGKAEEEDIVKTFVVGIQTWEKSAKFCIHALSLCCHELPMATSKALIQMINMMATIITQPRVAVHILEFLACLSRLPDLFVNFHENDYRTVFGICFRYLQFVRDKRQTGRHHSSHGQNGGASHGNTANNHSDAPPPPDFAPSAADELPQYVHALAYHVILFWFLALKLPDRVTHVGWIVRNLCLDLEGGGGAEEQALTTMDFMQRVVFADAGESVPDADFEAQHGPITTRRWLIGNSIVSIDQSQSSGWARITKRQPSGTSSYLVKETYCPPMPHQVHYNKSGEHKGGLQNTVLPSHVLVQLLSSAPQPADSAARPIPLQTEDGVDRALRMFDRHSMVDSHKVGVIYVGENQTDEVEILANVSGSSDYFDFLNGLGTLTRLQDAPFNTQGLDRQHGIDGTHTYCWRDRITEIVFHVTTQMPTNLKMDKRCTHKKKHIGNDFVNIIFNDSGLPFRFDTFPSDFNYVNIVITPEAQASFVASRGARIDTPSDEDTPSSLAPRKGPFYRVQVMSKPGFPEISPASQTKMISLQALPGFIRLVALNASVFSLVWANRDGGEHIGSWRARLREIKLLRERYGSKPLPQPSLGPSLGGANIGLAGLPPALQAQQQLQQAQTQQHPQLQLQHPYQDAARPPSSLRESIQSLRRTSVATFLTGTSEQVSLHRSSMISATTTAQDGEGEVDGVDFSKWA